MLPLTVVLRRASSLPCSLAHSLISEDQLHEVKAGSVKEELLLMLVAAVICVTCCLLDSSFSSCVTVSSSLVASPSLLVSRHDPLNNDV